MPGMCSECMAEVHGAKSYPMVSWGGSAWLKSMELNHILWSRGLTASTLDPESRDRGSNPRETFSSSHWKDEWMSGDDLCKQSSCMCQACAVSARLKSMGLSDILWSHGEGVHGSSPWS